MTKLNNINSLVQSELNTFKKFYNSVLKTDVPLLNIITRYVLRSKGLPVLAPIVFLTVKQYGKVNQSAHVAASLINLLHTASRVHDDVGEKTNESRSLFPFKSIWRSKLAVLMGDYLLSRGLLLAIKYNQFRMLEIISLAIKKISEGEILLQDTLSSESITADKYIEVIGNKLAPIMAASFTCGGLSARATGVDIELLGQAGHHFGISYLIQEDLSIYKKSNILKKYTKNKNPRAICNLPYIYALSINMHNDEAQSINPPLHSSIHENDPGALIEFVKENGGLARAREKMLHHKNLALHELDKLAINGNAQPLKELISLTIR
jgi:octaprenyl-diphosphate synthase